MSELGDRRSTPRDIRRCAADCSASRWTPRPDRRGRRRAERLRRGVRRLALRCSGRVRDVCGNDAVADCRHDLP